MKTLKIISLALLIMTALSFAWVSLSCSGSNDDDHLSANDAVYSSQGYLNKAIQQARTLSDQYLSHKDKAEAVLDNTQKDVSYKVKEQAVDKPKLELKQKQSSGAGSKKASLASAAANSANYDVKIGTGTDKRDAAGNAVGADGKYVSEVIDGVRHYYAGFNNDKIVNLSFDQAVGLARSGDKVIVKGGASAYTGTIGLVSGVSLYGGYNDNGEMDSKTIFGGNFTGGWGGTQGIEINGFDMTSNHTAISMAFATDVKIVNNIFEHAGIELGNGEFAGPNSSLIKNNIFNDHATIYLFFGNHTLEGNTINAGYLGGLSACLANIYLTDNNIYSKGAYASVGLDDSMLYSQGNNYYGSYSEAGFGQYYISGTEGSKLYSSNDYFANNNISYGPSESVTTGRVSAPNQPLLMKADNNAASLATALNNPQRAIDQGYFGKGLDDYGQAGIFNSKNAVMDTTGSIFKGLLMSRVSSGADSGLNQAGLQTLSKEEMSRFAVAAQGNISPQDMEAAMRLANILKNPTEDQKMIIDSISALLADVKKIEDGSAQGFELAKASDDLLQMVAGVLLAQALPDLLKQGDVANIKGIFSDLDKTKRNILLDYQISTKPYYEELARDLTKNMETLQLNNIFSGKISKEELAKLPPSELEKIIEKMRKMEKKSFEAEYVLQQEAKYRKTYLEPGKQKLEENMKLMLKDFTGRINKALK